MEEKWSEYVNAMISKLKEKVGEKTSLDKINEKSSYDEIKKFLEECCNSVDKDKKKEIESYLNTFKVAIKLKENPTIATHFGDDLDNKSSIYALESWSKMIGILKEDEKITVDRVPAGKVKEGLLNVDTGGHKGSIYDGETIVVDGKPPITKSAIEEIQKELKVEEYVKIPEQIVECADALPTKTSIFDTKSGMSLQKFATPENVFKMAQKGLLTRELTKEEMEEFNLTDSYQIQQKTVDEAVEKVDKYTVTLENGQKVVIAPEFIKAGSQVAYEKGCNYYVSTSKHLDSERKEDGCTFSISAKPGVALPENIKSFGSELVEKYKDETGASGVFLHPNGSLLVAGGPKNPDFKVEMSQEDINERVNTLFKEYAREDLEKQVKNSLNELEEKIDKVATQSEKINKAETLNKEVKEEIEKKDKQK